MQCVYVSDEHGIISTETVRTLSSSLPLLGMGATRKVYDLGDVVLKVTYNHNHFVGACSSEIDVWEKYEGTEYEECFAKVLASDPNGDWLIMEKVEAILDDYGHCYESDELVSTLEGLGIGDLHSQNVGIRPDGTWCAIDYSWEREPRKVCSCGDHDCEECYPNGCYCETFDGCKRVSCEHESQGKWCQHDAVSYWQSEGFGFLKGQRYVLCRDHKNANLPSLPKHCFGQRRLVIDIWGDLVPDVVAQVHSH